MKGVGERGNIVSLESVANRFAEKLAPTRNAIIAIIIMAVATRIVSWWNPVAHVDDQFYMLAGYDMLHGRWPYLEVWDRKPIGLFLLFAGIAAVGGKSVLVMNLIATAFAAATAFVIRQIALRYATAGSATMAALVYLCVIVLFGGQNGQTPVFYNLLISGSVLIFLRADERSQPRVAVGSALIAMLLCGLALSLKPPSLFEGCFVGLSFLWLFRRLGLRWAQVTAIATLMVAVALLPTVIAYLTYRAAGPETGQAFVYANFISIFQRENFQAIARLAGIAYFLLFGLPLMIMAGIGLWRQWHLHPSASLTRFLSAWLLFALAGYASVPAFFDHYALPLIPPLCVATAMGFDTGAGRIQFPGMILFCLIGGAITDVAGNRAEAATYERIRATVDAARKGGCVYVADGPSRLYLDFDQCRPTRFLFPDHLMLRTEANAIGTSPLTELRRVLDQHPAVIVARRVEAGRRLPEIQALLYDRLNANYRFILAIPKGPSASVDGVEVWQRKDLPPPAAR